MRNRAAFITVLLSLLVAVLVASGCGSSANSAPANNAAQAETVDVVTAPAAVVPMPTYIEATGNLTSDAQTDVAPAVGGKIVEVNFDIGSYVQQGSVLVRLDARDALIRLDQARAQVEQQRQAIQQAEANADQALANRSEE